MVKEHETQPRKPYILIFLMYNKSSHSSLQTNGHFMKWFHLLVLSYEAMGKTHSSRAGVSNHWSAPRRWTPKHFRLSALKE